MVVSRMTEKQVTKAFHDGKITLTQYHNRLREIGTRRHAAELKRDPLKRYYATGVLPGSRSQKPKPLPKAPKTRVVKIPYDTAAYQSLLRDEIPLPELRARIAWNKKQEGQWIAQGGDLGRKQAQIYRKTIDSMESLLPKAKPKAKRVGW